MGDIAFGFQAAPASEVHKSDHALYREVMDDCALGHKLGYDAAWLLEHHFSDYYPTPSPLLFMAPTCKRPTQRRDTRRGGKTHDPSWLGPF